MPSGFPIQIDERTIVKPKTIAFIGAGNRSVAWGRHYVDRDDVKIVALADPEPHNRKTTLDALGLPPETAQYDDYRELLDRHPELSAVVITTPNFLHAEHAVPCLQRGLPIGLEKPLATTVENCERIVLAEIECGGRALLGFVLRSTPIYSTVRRLLAEHRIGRVVSLQADELPGLAVTSIMNRSAWRRETRFSGGSMLEKSCHDMDLINWLVGSRPLSLNSYGGRRMFRPNPSLPMTCENCPLESSCLYYKTPKQSQQEDQAEVLSHRYLREDHVCIYNAPKDIADTQSVCIEYANGAVANFMLTFNCPGPHAGRNFHIIGTHGRLWGNLHEAEVFCYDNASDTTEKVDCSGDGSGHGGGDRLHALQLLRMIDEPDFRPEASATAGYLSAVMSLAADRSMRENRRLHFDYRADGLVDVY
jgi:predicted dehydrogenase